MRRDPRKKRNSLDLNKKQIEAISVRLNYVFRGEQFIDQDLELLGVNEEKLTSLLLNSKEKKIEYLRNLAINEAFAVLQLSRRQFEKLHTQQQKIECLTYAIGAYEFSYYKDLPEILALGKLAAQIIFQSAIIQEHVNEYSPNSIGLSEIDVPRMINEDGNRSALKMSRQSIMVTEPKNSGVEPGFMGYHNEDLFIWFFKAYPDLSDRVQKIRQYNGNIDALADDYIEDLARHVVKLTYEDVSESGQVVPSTTDLARTSTMKKIEEKFGWLGHTVALQIYQKAKTQSQRDLNGGASDEVLANDVARAFGMKVQKQYLLRNFHHSGNLRFLLKAEWIEGASLLKPLAGSSNNQNYYVEPVLVESSGIKYVSSQKIKDLPIYFALLVALGDRDKVGSHGQNLLEKLGELIGIDFGHAFPKVNKIADSIRFDFTFEASEFKNYSVFLDANRSELMKGVIRLKILRGDHIDAEVLKSYGVDFYQEIMDLQPHADERVFDDYIRKYKELIIDDKDHREEYEENIKRVEKNKARYVESRDKMIACFDPFYGLPAKLVDTLQNFERLWAARLGLTSMRSDDGAVMLQHLRVDRHDNPVVAWNTHACDNETIAVGATFKTEQDAEQAVTTLRLHGVDIYEMRVARHGKAVTIVFPRAHLSSIADIVIETNIKSYYHPEDFQLSLLMSEEKEFVDSLNRLKKYGLDVEVEAEQGRNIRFHLNPGNEDRSAEMANFIAKGLQFCSCDMRLEMGGSIETVIRRERIQRVKSFLTVFEACYSHYEKARNQLNDLSILIKKQENIHIDFILKLIYHQGQFKFHLMVRSGTVEEPINFDMVTEGDILQTIATLESAKSNVLQGYQNYKSQKYKVLLEQQIDRLCFFLGKKYPSTNASPQYFKPLEPGAQLRQYLLRWLHDPQHFSHASLKHLGETLKARLIDIEANRAGDFGAYLEEKGKLDDIGQSIRELQLLPELQRKYERGVVEESVTTVKEPYQEPPISPLGNMRQPTLVC